jgi:catechol 2,3-dioxygenase-like lactoylglutathione lyase family enzyme
MFDHVTIGVSDRTASERFYTAVLRVLGHEPGGSPGLPEWDDFSLAPADAERPVTRNLHLGFGADSREQVDAFWRAGVDAGYRSDGDPGERDYTEDYYGAFLLDPDGNSVEAVHYTGVHRGGVIDHAWIRVADVPAAQAFYAAIAPAAHLQPGRHDEAYAIFDIESGGSFSLIAGPPTQAVHLAFTGSQADVRAFHATALAAGYRDNGAPGERPVYHPGYFAAFVRDPDGHNVEVVSHRE